MLAQKIRNDFSQVCGIGAPADSNEVYDYISEDDYQLIISALNSTTSLTLTKSRSDPSVQSYQYSNNVGSLLTVNYYPSTNKMMIQTGSQELSKLFETLLSTCTTITPHRKAFANKETMFLSFTENETISKELEISWNLFVKNNGDRSYFV